MSATWTDRELADQARALTIAEATLETAHERIARLEHDLANLRNALQIEMVARSQEEHRRLVAEADAEHHYRHVVLMADELRARNIPVPDLPVDVGGKPPQKGRIVGGGNGSTWVPDPEEAA